MPNLLGDSSAWLEGQRHKHLTISVEYKRGLDSVVLLATVGRTVFELDMGRGILERWESRDYLVLTKDLILGASPALPVAGDRIRETQGATVYVYEVMSPGDEPDYRFSDDYRETLRIHTKLVDEEAAP